MGLRPSSIAAAEDAAKGLDDWLDRTTAKGTLTPQELLILHERAHDVRRKVRKAHRDQRAGISVIRTGAVALGIVSEFDFDEPDEAA